MKWGAHVGLQRFLLQPIALILSSIPAALAGTLHVLFQPLVSPYTASMTFTIAVLLMTLIPSTQTASE